MTRYRLSFSNLGWRGRFGLAAITIVGVAAAVALIVLSLGIALVLVPLAAITLAVARWRLRQAMPAKPATERDRDEARTIETDYHVIGKDDAPRHR